MRGRQHVNADWPQEKIDRLEQLVESGLSSSKIAAALGGISRNSVIGKAARMGFAMKGGLGGAPRRVSTKPRTISSAPPPEPEPVIEEPRADGVRMLDLGYSHCRWPLWDQQGAPDFMHCGRAKADGSPFCAEHHKRAYQRQPATAADRARHRAAERESGINRGLG